jgi:hypothetical protein
MTHLNENKISDIELVLGIANHIINPCFFPKDSREYLALRESYIILAETTVIPILKNNQAKEYLELIIQDYRPSSSQSN